MKMLIVEDEINNARLLEKQLTEIDPHNQVVGILDSVESAIHYLKNDHSADIIFMDIRLSDGYCFEIFEQVNIHIPVIFVTAYDEYVVSALQYNCLDYLLKPYNTEKLRHAITKYHQLESYFVNKNFKSIFDQLKIGAPKKIVVKRGYEFQTVPYADIAYFFVEQKIVFCVDNVNKKYTTEWANLADVYTLIDKNLFFKANRKYIISADYVKSFKHIDFGKTSVEMQIKTPEEIIISQENSQFFRNWIRGK